MPEASDLQSGAVASAARYPNFSVPHLTVADHINYFPFRIYGSESPNVAETVRFELTDPVKGHNLSKIARSATLPCLHIKDH